LDLEEENVYTFKLYFETISANETWGCYIGDQYGRRDGTER